MKDEHYRPDIDGLRAIAISVVVAFHYFSSLCAGGYIGVDVFFVISGFLITDMIQKKIEGGRFSLSDFGAGRIRRILPSLVVMFFLTIVLARFTLWHTEAVEFTKEVLYGSLFWSNMFLRAHSRYFDPISDLRPNLHLWSLAIEEQFYIFWPLVFYFTPARHIRKIVGIIFVASLAYCIISLRDSPKDSFYLVSSRLWELAAGGLLVLFAAQINHAVNFMKCYLDRILRHTMCDFEDLLSLVGLALIVYAAFFFDKNTHFPGWRALFPVVGAALLIRAGPGALLNKQMAKPFLVGLGLISYPLYLWHWVLLYFVNVTESLEAPEWEKLLAFGLSFAFAFLSYRFIEVPIRRRFRPWSIVTVGLIVSNICIAVLVFQVRDLGVSADPMPKVFPFWLNMNENVNACAFGDELKTKASWCNGYAKGRIDSVLLGDSHAQALYPGIVHNLIDPKNWGLIARIGCPPELGVADPDKKCREYNESLVRELQNNRDIKNVLIATAARLIEKTFATKLLSENLLARLDEAQTMTGLVNFLAAIQMPGRKIEFIMDAPAITSSPEYCVVRPVSFLGQNFKHCTLDRAEYDRLAQNYRKIVRALKERVPGLIVIDPVDVFCDSRVCTVMNNGVSNYSYSDHVSDRSSALIGRMALEKLSEPN